jgi:hypothetical protein
LSTDAALPDPPESAALRTIGIRADERFTADTDTIWWRVHRTLGPHVLNWNQFRHYGPVLRFDPHPEPRGHHPAHGVWYGAATPDAALAEAFQFDRTIDRSRDLPYLTGLSFIRPLDLLDLAHDSLGAWATRAGGTFAISTAPHLITQRWARAIAAAFPAIDGVRYSSRFAGRPCIALFAPAFAAMPASPDFSLPLAHPGLAARLAGAATRLGYRIV